MVDPHGAAQLQRKPEAVTRMPGGFSSPGVRDGNGYFRER